MPKLIPAALQAHYDTGATCLSVAILIQRLDGEVFGLALSSKPLILDVTPWGYAPWDLAGLTAFEFDSASGMEAISIQSTAGTSVDDGQLVALNKGEMFTEADIIAGRWRGARYRIFTYRWDVEAPTIADDVETLKVGTFGEIEISPVVLKIELHCLKRLLQQPVGIVGQPTCRVPFGSQGLGKCNVDLAPYTHALTVTSVADSRTFTCAAATQPDDAFGNGQVRFTSGGNEGLIAKVEGFIAGVFTLEASLTFPLEVGDTLVAIEGCRKRFVEDCKNRYANQFNFQGNPHQPTRDRIISGVAA
jgi:uncharacterized phage protein (TIGR02218 family)